MHDAQQACQGLKGSDHTVCFNSFNQARNIMMEKLPNPYEICSNRFQSNSDINTCTNAMYAAGFPRLVGDSGISIVMPHRQMQIVSLD
tara:strand:- start:230 stop:493 length:264 start_codon:yes stop_codon:yes gene_type:complete